MTKKSLMIASAIILPLTVGVMAMGIGAGNNHNVANNLFATGEQPGSITFNRTIPGTTQNISRNDYYYTSGLSQNGTKLYCYNASNVSLGTAYVAVMCGTFDKGSVEPDLRFLSANSGSSDFCFQSITRISMTSNTYNTRTLSVYTSNDGSTFSKYGDLPITSSGGSIELNGANYVRFGYSGSYSVYITDIVIEFMCSYQ